MTTAAVETEIRNGVMWIALNRPEKLNAINDDVLNGLLRAVAALDGDASLGAAVLFGRGRAFSAGGDIKAMSAMDDTTFVHTIGLYMQVAKAFRASSICPRFSSVSPRPTCASAYVGRSVTA